MDWFFASQIVATGILVIFIVLVILYILMRLLGKFFGKVKTAEPAAPPTPPAARAEEETADVRIKVAALAGAVFACLEKPSAEPTTASPPSAWKRLAAAELSVERKWPASTVSKWSLDGRKRLMER